MGFPVTGTGGAFVGPRVTPVSEVPSGEMASPAQAVRTASVTVRIRFFPAIQFLFFLRCARRPIGIDRRCDAASCLLTERVVAGDHSAALGCRMGLARRG